MFDGPAKRAHRKLQPLWTKLEARWNDDRAHHAFLGHVRTSADFGYARRLYRMAALQASSAQELTRESNAWRWLAALELRHRELMREPMFLNLARTVLLAFLLIEVLLKTGHSITEPLAALAVLEIGSRIFRWVTAGRRLREAAPYVLTGA
jgi:hypothetical protein